MGDVSDEAACARDSLATRSRLYAEYARGNRAAVLEAPADDVARHSAVPDGMPRGGGYGGREDVESRFARLDPAAQFVGYDVERVVARGERVAALARARVRFPAKGTEREFAAADILRIRGGRIAEFREFHDTAGVLEATQRPRAA